MRKWMIMFCLCFICSITIPVTYTTWYVANYGRHACQALEAITATPVTPPADPRANPSRVQDYHLYQGLKFWEREDGC